MKIAIKVDTNALIDSDSSFFQFCRVSWPKKKLLKSRGELLLKSQLKLLLKEEVKLYEWR